MTYLMMMMKKELTLAESGTTNVGSIDGESDKLKVGSVEGSFDGLLSCILDVSLLTCPL